MKNVTPNGFSDELIAQYLLGELAENEQIAIEDEAFSDPEVKERIAAIEQDLIDEYVRILSCGYVRKPYSCRGPVTYAFLNANYSATDRRISQSNSRFSL